MEKNRSVFIALTILFFSVTYAMEENINDFGHMDMECEEIEILTVASKIRSIVDYINRVQYFTAESFFSNIKNTYEILNKENERHAQIFIVWLDKNLVDELPGRYDPLSLKGEILQWLYEKRSKDTQLKKIQPTP